MPWLAPMLVVYAVIVIAASPNALFALGLVLLPALAIARMLYRVTKHIDYYELRMSDPWYRAVRYYVQGRDLRPPGGDSRPR